MRSFIALSLVVLALMYIVPYLFSDVMRGFSTYLYWALLSLFYMVFSIAYISKR